MRRMTKKIILYFVTFFFLMLLLLSGIRYNNRYHMQRQLSEKVVRFHVLANSDTDEDQTLKLKVRDAVGAALQEKMKAVDSKTSCERLLERELDNIEQVAKGVIAMDGYDYPVEASLRVVDFPVKSYGPYTFPAGSYEALEVKIGAGSGHNWWCVMYPNLCFAGSVYEETGEEADHTLREVLDEEEYKTVLESGNYKVKFKYLSFLNQLCE